MPVPHSPTPCMQTTAPRPPASIGMPPRDSAPPPPPPLGLLLLPDDDGDDGDDSQRDRIQALVLLAHGEAARYLGTGAAADFVPARAVPAPVARGSWASCSSSVYSEESGWPAAEALATADLAWYRNEMPPRGVIVRAGESAAGPRVVRHARGCRRCGLVGRANVLFDASRCF